LIESCFKLMLSWESLDSFVVHRILRLRLYRIAAISYSWDSSGGRVT
jgi:hypothetical protein